MLADKEDDFYADVHKVIKIATNFKKGDIIEPDPGIIRILWCGQVEPIRPAYATNVSQFANQHMLSGSGFGQQMTLPRHSIIISDQFTEPLLNVQC